jgi:hypothetical protein
LNITTASIGLRPARDLRSAAGLRQTRSSPGRNSSNGTTAQILISGSFVASKLA